MPPEHLAFGGGSDQTVLHPIALAAMLLTVVLIFLLPRRYVIVPFLSCAILIPLGQQLVVGGIHLMVLRILILAGCVRMFGAKLSSPSEVVSYGFGSLDKYFTAWAVLAALAPVLLFRQSGAVINSCGSLLDYLGGYFVLRYLIRDKDDIYRVLRTFAWICAIVAVGMSIEQLRDINVFGYLRSFSIFPAIREGRIRSQGPFAISILAGCFGATLVPLFYLLWKTGKAKVAAVVGVFASTIMVGAAASSTPLMAYAGGIFAICLWPLRKNMRAIRWGIVFGLVSLQLVMKAPVWFAITHFMLVGGSSNYQRAELIQQFVTHFSDWWLIGTKGNGNWGFDMWDLSNQFVAVGESGGLAAFLCFVGFISVGFKWVGKARKMVEGDRKQELFLWLLGAALFSHVVAFFGISYFDQTRVGWLALLAMIPAAAMPLLAKSPATELERAKTPAARGKLYPLATASRVPQRHPTR